MDALLAPHDSRIGAITFDDQNIPTLEIIGPTALDEEVLKELHEGSAKDQLRIRHTHEQVFTDP